MNFYSFSIGLTIILSLIISCSINKPPICKKNGQIFCFTKGIFRESEWYCHYECALSCIEGGCYEQAIKCLENSEKLKKDNKDQRMVRTYGMNFVDYFLHRERGIIYYRQGNYKQALEELTLSIQQEPSERAYSYLDRTRTEIIKKQKIDQTIPDIVFLDYHDISPVWTNKQRIDISGVVEDEQFVSDIYINKIPFFIKASSKTISFFKSFILPEGQHEIEVKATNIMKHPALEKRMFIIDRSGPVIEFHKFTSTTIDGMISDISSEILFKINNSTSYFFKDKVNFFSIPVNNSTNIIHYVATDKLGNKTVGNVTHPSIRVLTASNNISMSDDKSVGNKHNLPLNLKIDNVTSNNIIAYKDTVELKGFVEYDSPIQWLKINDKKVNQHPAVKIDFNQSITLPKNINTVDFEIHCKPDIFIPKKLTIERKIQKVWQSEQRRAIYMTPAKKSTSDAFIFQEMFLKKLIRSRRFKILSTPDFAFSNKNCIFIDIPNIIHYNLSNKENSEINVIVSIKDSKSILLDVFDAYCDLVDKTNAFKMDYLADRIVEQIVRKFPLMDGPISSKKNNLSFVTPETIKPDYIYMKYQNSEIRLDQMIQGDDNVIVYKEIDPVSPFGSDTEMITILPVKGFSSSQYSIYLSNHKKNLRGINK